MLVSCEDMADRVFGLGQDTADALYCSAQYQTNNLLNPVLFEEALARVPEQAVLLEVAPHGLLQAILKRERPANVHLALAQRGHPSPLRLLLAAIARSDSIAIAPKAPRSLVTPPGASVAKFH